MSSQIDGNVSSYVIDNSRTSSGDLLTVAQQAVDSDADTGARAASNIQTLQQTYPSIEIIEESEIVFNCDDLDIH
jgi:hypothetical protein